MVALFSRTNSGLASFVQAKIGFLKPFFPFDDKHNLMVSPTFSFAGFGDTLAPRPIDPFGPQFLGQIMEI